MPVINYDYKDKVTERFPSIEEKEVYRIIEAGSSENYMDAIQEDNRWFLFYHLSDYRSSMLRWYPFKNDASVLEIEAGMGAMTGALCDRVKKVTVTENSVFCAEAIARRYSQRDNLTIYAADFRKIEFKEKFDYIILFGQVERISAEYIDEIMSLLKADGILLVEVENKYGVQNLCGKRDRVTGMAFESFGCKNGRALHRAELEEIVKESQAGKWKFYYPMPDYIAPRVIYTDEADAGASIRERLPYYTFYDSSMINGGHDIYSDAAVNGAFRFVANNFVVEVVKGNGNCTDISYVTLSTTRTREKSFATIIHRNTDKVEKKPLYPDGLNYAEYLCNNTAYLQQRGINILPMELHQKSMWMNFVHAGTVQQYVMDLVQEHEPAEKLIAVFDKLWECILQSSERVDQCSFDVGNLKRDDIGPVLKYAYLEMISLNSFWIDGDILFFDQEVVKEAYPAKYILLRSIFFVYECIKRCEDYLPKAVLYERYRITDEMLQLCFQLEEKLGASENPYFIDRWLEISEIVMLKNRKILSDKNARFLWDYLEEEVFVKQVHEVQMCILYRFKELCEKYHLTYYLMYGTLLGAVRHQGKIPGDDDIDVAMPREDYDRLLQIADKELEAPFFLQTPSNDNCFYGGYSKLMNLNTSAIIEQNWWTDCREGISIDVFPLDYGYTDKHRERKKRRRIAFYQRLLFAKAYGYFANFKDMPLLVWKAYKYWGKLYPKEKLVRLLDEACKEGDRSSTAPYGIYTHYAEGKPQKQFARQDFEGTLSMRYEELNLPAPSGYDHILKTRYGRDYMRILMRQTGDRLHGFYAVNVPFANYKKRFQGGWRIASGDKKIVLFGDPFVVEQYLRVKGRSCAPEMAVYDTMAPWNDIQDDSVLKDVKQYVEEAKEKIASQHATVKTVTWEQYDADYKEVLGTDIYPIICTVNIRETERRLRRLGFREYYIFAYNRSMIALKEPLEYILMEGERDNGR